MKIYYRGHISQADFGKAVYLTNQFGRQKILFGLIFGVMVVATSISVFNQPDIVSYLFPGILFPMVFLSFPWWVPYLQVSTVYNNAGNIYRTPISGFIDDIGITINGQTTKASTQWNAYTHYKAGDGMLLLYQSQTCFNIFTPALFQSEAEWNEFVEVVKTKMASA